MSVTKRQRRRAGNVLAMILCLGSPALGLDPQKLLTQYSRLAWSQEQGLPQNTVRRLAQTTDGYLWVGTAEGLARFDGYEFVIFDRDRDGLPADSITALTASPDGSLWIGTPNGLAKYRDGHLQTFTTEQGLPDNAISALHLDKEGILWIAAGLYLSSYNAGRFTNYSPGEDIPITSVRSLYGDGENSLWVVGYGGVARWSEGKFVRAIDPAIFGNNTPYAIIADREDNIWIAGSQGLMVRSQNGEIRLYTMKDGLPDNTVRTVFEDSDGNIWAGTNSGIARFQSGRFTTFDASEYRSRELVFSIFEDVESNLWLGTNSGLERWKDEIFTVYGTSEGLPSDVPNTVFQDRTGRVWVGFHNNGLMLLSEKRVYTTVDGLPGNEVLSIRESKSGDLIVSTAAGLVRMTTKGLNTYYPPDPLARRTVYDALEDSRGRLWLATPSGLGELRGTEFHILIPGSPLVSSSFGVIQEGMDGSIWAGTLGKGLWRIQDGTVRLFTIADGLSSNGIRSLYEDPEGTLWIGTFGGGLNAFYRGKFHKFTVKDGLLSNNVSSVIDDGEYLWLSTSRGICQVARQDLHDFAAGRVPRLAVTNYGVQDGLRSAQCSPGSLIARGGTRTEDGHLWFPTSQGLAVLETHTLNKPPPPPVHLLQFKADGKNVDLSSPTEIPPGNGRLQIQFAAIHLSAPERVRYSHRLEGADTTWIDSGNRRIIDYNSLRPGKYSLFVRAELPSGVTNQQAHSFVLLPHFYETSWFFGICGVLLLALVGGAYRLRLKSVHDRFGLVLNERTRIAREIHDTLAQGFVGISSQLDAVALCMSQEPELARRHLNLARKMARHSLTEARRSVMDLRTSALEGQDVVAALESGVRDWTASSDVDIELDIAPPPHPLSHEIEHNLLRIAQEAIVNALKHSGATKIGLRLFSDAKALHLRITDDGRGFDSSGVFTSFDGHFGLVGMQERAERVRGELHLDSRPGGTTVEVTVPLL